MTKIRLGYKCKYLSYLGNSLQHKQGRSGFGYLEPMDCLNQKQVSVIPACLGRDGKEDRLMFRSSGHSSSGICCSKTKDSLKQDGRRGSLPEVVL